MALAALAGCGGGGESSAVIDPAPATSVAATLASASALAANDTSTNSSASFTVLQDAGVSAVTINSPPKVNFTVFSDGKVKTGLVIGDVRFAIAKLVPGVNNNPDEWVNYISVSRTAVAGLGSGGNATPRATARQATTDSKKSLQELELAGETGQLIYNPDGYYTYSFKTDITKIAETNGVVYEPTKTHRVAIQLSYKNAANETVLVNPYFDFTIVDGKSVPATGASTRVMANVASCNGCHEKLALHGGGRVDTQYCVMCHNPSTVDPESGNNLNMATMVHKIHSGKLLKSRLAAGGEDYKIWGYGNKEYDYSRVGFPQDLRNCTTCHSADTTKTKNPTPQGDNWKTRVSKEACLTCHASGAGSIWRDGVTTNGVVVGSHTVFAGSLVGTGSPATAMTNKQCANCHVGNISSEQVHWNQNEENSAKYKMNIESATYNATTRKVTVKYSLTDPTNANAAYNLVTSDCANTTTPTCSNITKFGNVRLWLAYPNMVGQQASVTEFTSFNNGGGSAAAFAYQGLNDGANRYAIDIPVPADTGTAIAGGTARVITVGQVKEAKLDVKSRLPTSPAALVNTAIHHTHKDVLLSGAALQPRRVIVSNEKCNVCHSLLGTTSGSNTLENAFHRGERDTVESCVLCHDANRMSSGKMTNGLDLNESRQFKTLIHGIHGNSKRTYPYSPGNAVVAAFNMDGTRVGGGASLASKNYAAEVSWPGVGVNCNACHVNNSYKSDQGTLGTVIKKDTGVTDPNGWKVISPKASSCTSCHNSSAAIGHVTTFGGSAFGDKTQLQISGLPRETCDDCHSSGGFKGVDIVHKQK